MKRAAIYVRVSTDKQTTENQLPELRALAQRRGFDDAAIVVFSETESGAKRRPVLEGLIDRAREFDAVFVWALDRLTRRGTAEALRIIQQLKGAGCGLVSARESWLDTSDANPFGDVLISFAATLAKLERERLRERTVAGLDQARRRGVRLGRPRTAPARLLLVADAVQRGSTLTAACKAHGVSPRSYRRWLSQMTRAGENPTA